MSVLAIQNHIPMKHHLLLWLVACSCSVSYAQSDTPDRKATALRQRLISQETTRKQQVSQFLRKKPIFRREFTDAKGTFHFLHHIDEAGQPVYYVTRSNVGLAASINTNKLWSGGSLGLNLQGQGMEVSSSRSRLGMFEPGAARTSHVEFGGRAIPRDTPLFTTPGSNADHATHVAGTMIATGVQPLARGMANQARLDCYEIQNDELVEMQTAASEGMLVSNHSYGPSFDSTRAKLGVYDQASRDYDNIAYQNKSYLQFHAAGNDRDDENSTRYDKKPITYDILIGGANGKNVATVGAVRTLPSGYTGPASVQIADFSSYGPTDDGRIKPDFVAPGVDILSPYSASDMTYASISGTSMASPGAAGSLFLLQQHHRNTKNAFMRAATLKGLAIHTADEAGTTPGPDYRFGWGLLNLEKAIQVINQTNGALVMEEASLVGGANYRKAITTTGGPFKATICWTDLPGTPLVNGGVDNRQAMLVNDLDVRLIDPATNLSVAQLPWKLDPANPAAAASRGDNVVDNVEQIFVENLPAGQYVIEVTHKGTLQGGPQEFSVFATSTPAVPVVKLTSTDPNAAEGKTSTQATGNGQLVLTRARLAAQATNSVDPGFIRFERSTTSGPLVVNYTIGGTATNGVDYATLPTSVTFADGQAVLLEEMDPIDDDIDEDDETIILTLIDEPTYDPDPSEQTTTLTIKDASPFSITGVTTVSCQTATAGLRRVSFTPQYAGLNGQPVSFSVVNEMPSTTAAGPYTLNLYTDNPRVTLSAQQANTAGTTSFTYNWLTACSGGARVSAESVTELQIQVLGNPVQHTVEVRVTGANERPLTLMLTNLQGRQLGQQHTSRAEAADVYRFDVSTQPSGLLLLQVSTGSQTKTVKIVKEK